MIALCVCVHTVYGVFRHMTQAPSGVTLGGKQLRIGEFTFTPIEQMEMGRADCSVVAIPFVFKGP
ncbi:MAG: hypothetical protein ONB46_22950 [candidate division KSB1 bacterium]|nr:hypothetical protein [candidate division KSB1 bacterium]MDZ7368722.1 hypothetical protein [candidate division KSB1 bacterium]MDZ7406537.1 hypothetical protein [candidate division KSB1 bacterium]